MQVTVTFSKYSHRHGSVSANGVTLQWSQGRTGNLNITGLRELGLTRSQVTAAIKAAHDKYMQPIVAAAHQGYCSDAHLEAIKGAVHTHIVDVK